MIEEGLGNPRRSFGNPLNRRVTTFDKTHMDGPEVAYLDSTGLDLALPINLDYTKLQWKRIIN